MPSWLRELRAEAMREEPSYAGEDEEILPGGMESPAAEKEEMPSWLRDMRSEAAVEEATAPEEEPEMALEEDAVPQAGEEDVPSWLRQLLAACRSLTIKPLAHTAFDSMSCSLQPVLPMCGIVRVTICPQ